MREIVKQSKKFTKKDLINSRSGEPLQGHCEETLTVLSCAIIHDTDNGGEERDVGTLVTDQGTMTTISKNIIESIEDIIMLEEDGEEKIQIIVDMRKSKQGRDYLSLTIL